MRTFAKLLGYTEAVALLQATLDEEGQADKALTKLAETVINLDAKSSEANGKKSSPKKKTAPKSKS